MKNALIIILATFVYCSVVFCSVGALTRRRWTRFRTHHYTTTAIVVGYGSDDPAQWSKLSVSLPEYRGIYSVCDTHIGNDEKGQYRIGQEVDVRVMDRRILGIPWPMVWLADRPLPDPKKKARPWFVMGVVCIGIVAIMLVVLIAGA